MFDRIGRRGVVETRMRIGIPEVGSNLRVSVWDKLPFRYVPDLADVDPVAGIFAVRGVFGRRGLRSAAEPEPESLGVEGSL